LDTLYRGWLGNEFYIFHVSIAEEAPRFDVPLDDPIYLFKNTRMEIKCKPSGGPIPTTKWQKDGQDVDLTTAKYSLSGKNPKSLIIENVQESDAGEYTCFAENTVGTGVSSTGTAIVLGTVIDIIHVNVFVVFSLGKGQIMNVKNNLALRILCKNK